VWDNVIDGEIVGEDQIPDSKKIVLPTDGIFVHVDEASGGGIIYYKKGEYVWIQQD
jgi:glutamate/tyrosine decarboxylase-like PLP-dependent enzyme